MEDRLKIGVGADYEPVTHKPLEGRLGEHVDFINFSGITGDTAAWVVISTLTAHSMPHILNFIKFLIRQKKLKSFQFGKLKVDNPTEKMTDLLEKELQMAIAERKYDQPKSRPKSRSKSSSRAQKSGRNRKQDKSHTAAKRPT